MFLGPALLGSPFRHCSFVLFSQTLSNCSFFNAVPLQCHLVLWFNHDHVIDFPFSPLFPFSAYLLLFARTLLINLPTYI